MKMLKHKVGDTVRIRSWEWIDAQEKDQDGDIHFRGGPIFFSEMFWYAGKIAEITNVSESGDRYRLDVDNGKWWWINKMFDPDFRSEDAPLSAEDAIIAMVQNRETLYNKAGDCSYHWDGCGIMITSARVNSVNGYISRFNHMEFRRSPSIKRKRPMTRWEILAWANSEESRGWVVAYTAGSGDWSPPQYHWTLPRLVDSIKRPILSETY
jgi:hypothetical protein